jgi:hypothetical protein
VTPVLPEGDINPMIKEVVGARTYSVWIDMLKRLVPGGRTHRLSVVAAGMLQVAYEIAQEKEKKNTRAKKLAEIIRNALEGSEEAGAAELTALIEKLFRDAKVGSKRTSRQGQAYSIAGDAALQFIHWDDMPWE